MKTSQNIELNEARNYLLILLPKAGKILMNYFTSKKYEIHKKQGNDFATDADLEVDRFLRDNLSKKFPQSNFLTEESAPDDYSTLIDAQNLWVIDPIDGTYNFSRGNQNFAISVALVDKGFTKLGVVYLPVTKDLYWADKNSKEAYCNRKKIKVSSINKVNEAILTCDWSKNNEKKLILQNWLERIITKVRYLSIPGSIVVGLVRLAEGKVDGYFIIGGKPWDYAASSLIVEKAGGKITTPEGGKWNIFSVGILATNGIIHEEILGLINPNGK